MGTKNEDVVRKYFMPIAGAVIMVLVTTGIGFSAWSLCRALTELDKKVDIEIYTAEKNALSDKLSIYEKRQEELFKLNTETMKEQKKLVIGLAKFTEKLENYIEFNRKEMKSNNEG